MGARIRVFFAIAALVVAGCSQPRVLYTGAHPAATMRSPRDELALVSTRSAVVLSGTVMTQSQALDGSYAQLQLWHVRVDNIWRDERDGGLSSGAPIYVAIARHTLVAPSGGIGQDAAGVYVQANAQPAIAPGKTFLFFLERGLSHFDLFMVSDPQFGIVPLDGGRGEIVDPHAEHGWGAPPATDYAMMLAGKSAPAILAMVPQRAQHERRHPQRPR